MQIIDCGPLIRVDFKYNPETVSRIKTVPGARFQKDALGACWTIPAESLNYLLETFNLSPGALFPGCKRYINRNYLNGLQVELKHDRLKASGYRAPYLSQSIFDLCSIEYLDKNAVIRYSVAQEIYNKNNIIVIRFPPGLYWRVLDFLNCFDCDIEVHPYPAAPKLNPVKIKVDPRYYQQSAVDKILNHSIPNRGVLVMATGAGKTLMSAMITAALGMNTIFYTYSTDLLDQTAEVYEGLFQQKIGRVGGDYFDIQSITIATVQTVSSCYEKKDERWEVLSGYLDSVDLMFVDEGHMLGADTIFTVAEITDAYYSYSLTATPFREDGKELLIEAGTGPIQNIIAEEELVKQGFILPVTVDVMPVQHPVYKARTYNGQYKKHIVENVVRNNMIAAAAKKYEGKQTIVLVEEIKHGDSLSKILKVPFVHGNSPNRKEILSEFKSGQISTLIASSILKQGIDIPEAEVLILAHGGVSTVELMQKIGRVRRPAPGKSEGIVVDFYDYCENPINDIFRRQSEKRIALYRSKKFTVVGLNPEYEIAAE